MAAGIEEVEWVAEDDSRTCKICRERNGKVYKIDEIPPKPHYNCRCTLKLTEKSLKREGREA
jgi:SPP1 gp7 family putative phage head morphogenesis protein